MTILLLMSFAGCTTTVVVGDFCDRYTVIDMHPDEAEKLERKYQDRILANEKLAFNDCGR